jgi:hypothetical protein
MQQRAACSAWRSTWCALPSEICMRTRCRGVQVRRCASGAVTFAPRSAPKATPALADVVKSMSSHGASVCFLVCRSATTTCYEASRRRVMKCVAQPLETFPGVPRVQLPGPRSSVFRVPQSRLSKSSLSKLRSSRRRESERSVMRRVSRLGSSRSALQSVAPRSSDARHDGAVTSCTTTAGAVTVQAWAVHRGSVVVRSLRACSVCSGRAALARAGSVA